MPIGSFSLIYHMADQLQKHRPKSVLDLGVGYGLLGALVRQYLDNGVFTLNKKHDNGAVVFTRDWGTTLIGVEGFEGYMNPQWEVYDQVHVCEIKEFVNRTKGAISGAISDSPMFICPAPEFIVLSDVLEHFRREEGQDLINDLMRILAPGGVLMIGTPGVWCEQGAVHGNEYERHKSLWAWNEFPPGFEVIKNGQGDEFGHYMVLVKYVKPK